MQQYVWQATGHVPFNPSHSSIFAASPRLWHDLHATSSAVSAAGDGSRFWLRCRLVGLGAFGRENVELGALTFSCCSSSDFRARLALSVALRAVRTKVPLPVCGSQMQHSPSCCSISQQ